MGPKKIKKSVDIPESLFMEIMEFALNAKLYKFGPAVVALIEKGLLKDA